MKKIIIIYNSKNDNFTKINNNNIIKYNCYTEDGKYNKFYDLYDGRYMNPPFFDKIILLHNELKEEHLKMVYNMLKINGSILFIDKYKHFFSNITKNNNLWIKQKKDNFIYTFQNKRIVEFIIIGAQKCGTTALSLNIGKHPNIYINMNKDPAISEVHFFDIKWNRGIEWYKKQFNYSKKCVGEKTPELLYLANTFPNIQYINPYVKLIIILRNPVERAYSQWKHNIKNGYDNRSFEEACNDEIKNKLNENKTFWTAQRHYLQRGLYYKQIVELLKWFPMQNILILFQENVIQNMETEYNKVYSFLNLEPFSSNYQLEYISNDKTKINDKIYKKLYSFFKKDILSLEKLLGIKTGWN
jgi:hypothetical protein